MLRGSHRRHDPGETAEDRKDFDDVVQDVAGWELIVAGREERTGDSFGLGRECERLG